jgi:hypothetical protein
MTLILTLVSPHHNLSIVRDFSVSLAPALWAARSDLLVARCRAEEPTLAMAILMFQTAELNSNDRFRRLEAKIKDFS